MEALNSIIVISDPDLKFVLRIVISGILAGLIGLQRQFSGSSAGYRTHAMIAVGAAAFTSISVDLFPSETGRIIQGILTGVGFLGAGVIWQTEEKITGLTTAAGIWSVASVGVMIGTGEYFMGLSLSIIIFIVLQLPAIKRS